VTILPTVSDAPKVVAAANSVTFSWHPDGQQVYAAMLGAKTATPTTFSGIVAFSPGGAPTQTQPLAFVKSDTLGPADPEISPNGSQILFTVVNQPDLAHRQIIGLFLQSLVTATPPKQLARGPISGVQWSPDSVKILALLPHPRSSSHDLWVISADGSSPPINITQGSGDITSAAWSPSLPKSAASN
jgi:Tol biopolymer transport system component